MVENIFIEENDLKFWKDQRDRIANALPDETIDFSGETFRKDPDGKYFHGVEFKNQIDFTGSIFLHDNMFKMSLFFEDCIFTDCTFPNGAIFMFTVFFKDAEFENVVFEDKVRFAGVVFRQDANFSNSTFKSIAAFESEETPHSPTHKKTEFEDFANFDNCIWKEHVQFLNVIFHNEAFFQNGVFEYNALFDRCEVNGTTNFENVRFLKYSGNREKRRNRARFLHNRFNGKVTFRNSYFDCPTRFVRNHFHDQAEFRKVIFGDSVLIEQTNHFYDQLFLDESYKTFSRPQDATEPYRIAKQTAHQAGDSRMEGNYHFQEQCAENAKNRKIATPNPITKKFWQFKSNRFCLWLEVLIGRWIFGYGEKPLRPLGIGVIVILVCGTIFWKTKGIDHNPPCSFLSSMYFSIVTFTTLGYGDFKPVASMRWLSATEAILGAGLMAMFIVSLSRKFSR